MKFIQIVHKYEPYIHYFEKKYDIERLNPTFSELQQLLIQDGFYGPHILKPIFDGSEDAFYIMWDYERLQFLWAKENGFVENNLLHILTQQIQKFNPEVIYNLSPQKIPFEQLVPFQKNAKLIAWNADPYSIHLPELQQYDALLTSSVNKVEETKNAYLHYPAADVLMNENIEAKKEIDVFFYGQYDGDAFGKRRQYIDELVRFLKNNNIRFKFSLMYQQKKKLKYNIPFVRRFDFAYDFQPEKKLTQNFSPAIFGKDIYKDIARAKIVFNISAENENFGDFKFNMRIFETLGVGTFMLSDQGKYPPEIIENRDFVAYENLEDLKKKIKHYLSSEKERESIAQQGKKTIDTNYSKEIQWNNFKSIINKL